MNWMPIDRYPRASSRQLRVNSLLQSSKMIAPIATTINYGSPCLESQCERVITLLALYRAVWRSDGELNFFDAIPEYGAGSPTSKLPIRSAIPSLSLATNSLRYANWTFGASTVLIASIMPSLKQRARWNVDVRKIERELVYIPILTVRERFRRIDVVEFIQIHRRVKELTLFLKRATL